MVDYLQTFQFSELCEIWQPCSQILQTIFPTTYAHRYITRIWANLVIKGSILGIALDIQKTFIIGHPVNLNFLPKKQICVIFRRTDNNLVYKMYKLNIGTCWYLQLFHWSNPI